MAKIILNNNINKEEKETFTEKVVPPVSQFKTEEKVNVEMKVVANADDKYAAFPKWDLAPPADMTIINPRKRKV